MKKKFPKTIEEIIKIRSKCRKVTSPSFKRKIFTLITNPSTQNYPSESDVYSDEVDGIVIVTVRFENSVFYFYHDIDWRETERYGANLDNNEGAPNQLEPFIAFITNDGKHAYYIEYMRDLNSEFRKWLDKIDAIVINIMKQHNTGTNFLKLL